MLSNNTYKDRPSIRIKHNLEQGLVPIQKDPITVEQPALTPTNEEDNIGAIYSQQWIQYHLSMAVEMLDSLLKHFKDVLKMRKEEQELWMTAMKEEIKSLHERKVWDVVDLPKGCQTIKGRWVYAMKSNGHKKARFVTKGFTQVFRIDYKNTFSPVTWFETLQLLLSLAVLHDWKLEALDVKTAFLFRELKKEINMDQPEGSVVKGKEFKVCHLWKAIYSLKQAALQWNKQLHKSFTRSLSDPGTYFKITSQDIIILLVYVDDALFMGSNKTQVLTHNKQFMKRWESHDLGKAKEYLGMRITRNCKKWTITLDQTCYAEKVVKWFGQENCKPISVPLPTGYNLRSNPNKEANATLQSQYQLIIGSLLYIMLGTQPDIAYSIIKMLQFSVNQTKEHLQKVLYIVHYLSSTTDLCICYSGLGDKNGFIVYSDMDWGGNIETSRSITGYAMFLANGIISWLSQQ